MIFTYVNKVNKLKTLWQTFRGLGILTPMVLYSVVGPALGALILIARSEDWYPVLESMNLYTQITVYISLSIFLAGISLIPTHASSLVAGMLFGAIIGPLIAVVGIVGASLLSFVLVKLVIRKQILDKLLERPMVVNIYEDLLLRDSFKTTLLIVLIRLSPTMPFAVTNVILAASRVKSLEYTLGSLVGLAPRIVVVAVAGAGLTEIDFSKGSHVGLAALGVISTLVLVAYVVQIFKKVMVTPQSE